MNAADPQRGFGGRVAFVTGGATGIGRAAVARLLAEGAAVGAIDLDGEALGAVVSGSSPTGAGAIGVTGDVRRAADVERAVSATVDVFGGVDFLVNVAGVLGAGNVVDCDEEAWDRVLDTNLKGQFLCARRCVPEMRRRGGGAIVNVGSVLAFAGLPGGAAYAASKGGIVALTTAMAIDHVGEGIRVNCVVPGNVRTPMLRDAVAAHFPDDPKGTMEELGSLDPLGRLIEPDEVARLIVFLLSDDAAAITGGCHRVDGGLLSRLAVNPEAVNPEREELR